MTIVFAVKVGNSGGVLFACALNFKPTELYGLLSAAETLLKAAGLHGKRIGVHRRQ